MVIPSIHDTVINEETRTILRFFARHMKALANGELSYGESPFRENLEDVQVVIGAWDEIFGLDLESVDLEELDEYMERPTERS